MSNAKPKAKLLTKIEKLMRRTLENGATEAEVEAALRLADKLMTENNIQMAEVLAANADAINDNDVVEMSARKSYDVIKFEKVLLHAVSDFCEVSHYTSTSFKFNPKTCKQQQTKSVIFYGLAIDVQAAILLYNELRIVCRTSARATLGKWTQRHWRYCEGFAYAISQQVAQIVRERETKRTTNTTALIVCKKSLIKTFTDNIDGLRYAKSRGFVDPNSEEFRKGRIDGADYEISADRSTKFEAPKKNLD